MMITIQSVRICILIILTFTSNLVFGQAITRIYTDFNTYWDSQVNNSVAPTTSHNLLAFSWNGNTYSTGVNDAKLTTNSVAFVPLTFQAFPASSSPTPNGNTYIGVASSYGGGDGNITPVPVTNNLLSYITDGTQGLDIGTAIFNFPASSQIQYQISDINPTSIGDGIPDIIFTQVGQVGDVNDIYNFTNASNVLVGNPVSINFSTSIPSVANGRYKFYSPANPTPTYQSGLYGLRPLRMMAFDWSDFGITFANATSVKYFIQKFSGVSDIAFTAYNKSSMGVVQSISGSVFNDNNAGTPDGNGYSGATVRLYNSANVLINTVTTGSNGVYIFPNVFPGSYRIELETPSGFTIVGATDNNTDNLINVTLNDVAIQNQNFGINQPPTANNDIQGGEKNTAITINLTTDDVDPNSGSVVPSSINLIPPSGATSIVTVSGNVKGFTISGTGTWSLNSSGVLTFTPVTGFVGNIPVTGYTIYDTAGLISNTANIILTIYKYCTKPGTTGISSNPTKFGISTHSVKLSSWPESIPNGFIALESNTKGFVITRVQNSSLITDPKEGMIIYDIAANCVKLYANNIWKCIARDCNE
jgi:hypothetical protein